MDSNRFSGSFNNLFWQDKATKSKSMLHKARNTKLHQSLTLWRSRRLVISFNLHFTFSLIFFIWVQNLVIFNILLIQSIQYCRDTISRSNTLHTITQDIIIDDNFIHRIISPTSMTFTRFPSVPSPTSSIITSPSVSRMTIIPCK